MRVHVAVLGKSSVTKLTNKSFKFEMNCFDMLASVSSSFEFIITFRAIKSFLSIVNIINMAFYFTLRMESLRTKVAQEIAITNMNPLDMIIQ